MAAAQPNVSSSRYLLMIMTAVVLCFLLATAISQYHVATVESHVRDSIGNALPSANRLSESRGHLSDLMNAAIELSEGSSIPKSELRRQILAAEQDMHASFASYLALPQFPEERELAANLSYQLDEFSEALRRHLSAGKIGPSGPLRAQATLLEHAYRNLIEFELTHGERLGLNISKLRFESLVLSILLDAICVALAVAAAILAIRIKSSSVKLLEERARELENFAFRVAHDLKNPLGVIKMGSELVLAESLDQNSRAIVEKISDTSRSMAVMIDGLLDFARSGARPEPGANVELNQILGAVMMWAKPEAERAKIRLEVPAHPQQLLVKCSDAVLNSVISNLIRNALKFVRDGRNPHPKVEVKIAEQDSGVRIEVEDNGPGVAPDKMDSIFEPYFRASTKHQGIGLGLATVKRLVESHGGKVGVNSQVGKGSCFWVELPCG